MLHLPELNSQNLLAVPEDGSTATGRITVSDDMSPRQLKQLHPNNQREVTGHSHGGQHMSNGLSSVPLYSTPSPITTQVGLIIPAVLLLRP